MNRRHFISTSSAALAATAIPSCSSAVKTLTVFTWAEYLSKKAKEGFEKANNCKLVIDTFDSNEALLAKLESGASAYDLLVPSSYTVPYMTAPTCLSYLASKVPNPVESWSMIDRPDLKGRVTLLDDMREVLGAALKLMGHSLNSIVSAELAAARDVAIRWKKNIAKFENEQYKTGIASGEFVLVQGYAGDLIQASKENDDMRIFIPQEGSAFSCDDLCILKNCAQKDLAHAFINYLTDPEVAAENMEWIGYRAPNSGAYSRLSKDFRSRRSIARSSEHLVEPSQALRSPSSAPLRLLRDLSITLACRSASLR